MGYPQTSDPTDVNRKRNTVTNQRTHTATPDYVNPGGAAALPALSPASTANYYAQLGNLYALYENQLAVSKASRVGLRADARVAKADTRSALIGGLAAEENEAIGRGVLGGSAELQSRIGLRGQAASDRASVASDLQAGLAASRLGDQAAGLQMFQGQTALAGQALAEQQAALAQELQTNAIISGAESSVDAMTAVYKALLANSANPPGTPPAKKPTTTPRPSGAYSNPGSYTGA
jgi:hypothetical protein